MKNNLLINSADEMLLLGNNLAKELMSEDIIYLFGNLGAGKTTLVKGILQGMGYTSSAKSPTYTLLEQYKFDELTLNHYDLYRLTDPEELEWMGIRDNFTSNSIALIEWPQKGIGFLPEPTKTITIDYISATQREVIIS